MAKRTGFTLVELLVVIAIIGILIGMLLPAVQMVRESARRTSCSNKLRQVSLAVVNYESGNEHLPAGLKGVAEEPRFQSWLQQILPHLEQSAIYGQALEDYRTTTNPFAGHRGMQRVVDVFQCPSDPESGIAHWTHENQLVASTNYLGLSGLNRESRDGLLYLDSKVRVGDIKDGLSNTLLVGERPPSQDFWYGWWYAGLGQDGSGSCDMVLGMRETLAPVSAGGVTNYLENCGPGPYHFERGKYEQCDALHYWSYHPGGSVFGLADGSVRFFSYASDEIMPTLATRSGGEVNESN